MMGHFFGADFSYMPAEHLAEMAAADPLPRLRALMLDHQFTQSELDRIVADIDAEIDEAVAFAIESPVAGPEELRKDVFEEEIVA
jgi:pyruvate dehydrogenase E1 component alpha subunit